MSDKINVDTRKLHTDLVIIQDCLDQSTIDRRNIQNDYQDLIKNGKALQQTHLIQNLRTAIVKLNPCMRIFKRKWTHCLMYAIRLRLVKKM